MQQQQLLTVSNNQQLHISNLGIGLVEKINNLKVTWVNDNNKKEEKTWKICEIKERRTLFKRFAFVLNLEKINNLKVTWVNDNSKKREKQTKTVKNLWN